MPAYLFKTHRINFTNVFFGLLMTDQQDYFCMPCKFKIANDEFLDISPGGLVNRLIEDPKSVRNTSWSTSTEVFQKLKNFSNQTVAQSWAIGNHSTEEIIFLKNYFQESAITIGILYNKTDYRWLLDNIARHHIFLLNIDPELITLLDKEILSNLSLKQQVRYYANAFDQLDLISKESNDEFFDVNIWVQDLIDLDKMLLHFSKIGVVIKQSTIEYYKPFINIHKERWKKWKHLRA